MNTPLVSVIITTYNREKYLDEAISSVINQTFKNFEILVIDDGSKQNYAENICNKYKDCYYFFKNNGGVSSARNYGIRKSKGTYIAFLDDDDYWKPNKLEKQVKLLSKYTDVDCIHSSLEVIDEAGKRLNKNLGATKQKAHKRSGFVFWNALGVWLVKASTPLIRKKVFTKGLLFDESLEVGEDTDFYQRMFYKHKVLYINEPLAYYREYKDAKRLSLQLEKYIGLEKKQLENFKKMNIKNPIVLYFITLRLTKSAQRRMYLFNGYEISNNFFTKIKIILRPHFFLNKFSKPLS